MKHTRTRRASSVDQPQEAEPESLDAQRTRLANLIGRLLARHWLRRGGIADCNQYRTQTGDSTVTSRPLP